MKINTREREGSQRGFEMELTKTTIKDGQTWLTIKSGHEHVVIHIKNAEAKRVEQSGTTINLEV